MSDAKPEGQQQNSQTMIALIQAQQDLKTEVAILKERQNTQKEVSAGMSTSIEYIKNNMATKDDMVKKQEELHRIESGLKEDIIEAKTGSAKLESSLMQAFEKFKGDIMPKIDGTAKEGGSNLLKTSILTTKFNVLWAVFFVTLSGTIGWVISYLFNRA